MTGMLQVIELTENLVREARSKEIVQEHEQETLHAQETVPQSKSDWLLLSIHQL